MSTHHHRHDAHLVVAIITKSSSFLSLQHHDYYTRETTKFKQDSLNFKLTPHPPYLSTIPTESPNINPNHRNFNIDQ